jgi:Family of unknown function (DUF6113)
MRLLLHGIALLVGAAVAVASVTVHRSVVVQVPLGLLLALAATFVTAAALRGTLPGLATSYAAGWLVAFGFALFGKPEGDYVVAADLRGYTMMGAAFVVAVLGLASLSRRGSSSVADAT